jgi:hypothetical protein
VPICSRCNLSMGSQYTFAEWCDLKGEVGVAAAPAAPAAAPASWFQRVFCCCTSAPAVAAQVAPYQDLPAGPPGPVVGPQAPDVSRRPQTPRTPRKSRTPRAASPSAKR